MHNQELVLEEKRLRNYGTDAARPEQPGQGGDEVDEKNDPIAHRRIAPGRGTLSNYGRNNNSPVTTCDRQCAGSWTRRTNRAIPRACASQGEGLFEAAQ